LSSINERNKNVFLKTAAISFTLAICFTIIVFKFSKDHGKLLSIPLYDDCVYFLKSTTMIEDFRKGRFLEAIPAPIHSPFSVLLAGGAFALLGHHDYAPYLANGLIIFGFLGFLGMCLQPISVIGLVPLLILFLCLPFSALAILEFRPDLAWGILVGALGVLLVTRPRLFQSVSASICTGLLLALCLLTKPSTFAMSFLIFFGGAAASFLIGWSEKSGKVFLYDFFRGFLISLLTAFILVLPYFIYEGSHIWNYFVIHSFGVHKDLWKFTGDFREQIRYYITGLGGQSNLGPVGALLSLWTFLAMVAIVWQGNRQLRLKVFFGALLIMSVYTINTMALAKSPFLGAAIYGSFFCFTAWMLGQVWSLFPRFRTWLVSLWWASAFVAILLFRWPPASMIDSKTAAFQSEANRKAYSVIKSALDNNSNRRVLVLLPGPIIPEVLALWAVREGRPLEHVNGAVISTEDELQKELSLAQIVVSQDSGLPGSHPNLPIESLLDTANRLLKESASFSAVDSIRDENGKSIFIYEKLF
jgi:hypothetical protein